MEMPEVALKYSELPPLMKVQVAHRLFDDPSVVWPKEG
jgi:hypothetical protein